MGSAGSFLLDATLRDLRRGGAAGLGAFLLVLLTVLAVGGLLSLWENMERIVAGWRAEARVMVYLREEPPGREEWLAGLQALDGVLTWRWVSPDEALGTLRSYLGPQEDLLARLPSNPLPASVEVAPTPTLSAAGLRRLVRELEALPGVEEVRGPGRWVEWTEVGRGGLLALGLLLTGLLALAALGAVTAAVATAVVAGREEAALARLVGASEAVVRLPLLLSGVIHGAVGAGAGVALLAVAERHLFARFGPALREGLGLDLPAMLGAAEALGLVAGGVALGALGALVGGRGR